MGAAVAAAFASEGRPLILCDLREASLEAVAAPLRDKVPVIILAGDITDPGFSAQIIAALNGGTVGALVHAAGVSPSMADGKRVFAINFTATQTVVEALLPHMTPGGAAILIASNSAQMIARPLFDRVVKKILRGNMPLIGKLMLRGPRTAYPLSKRAVQLYAVAMAPAFGKLGARIVSLSPGIIDTEMGRLENSAGPEMQMMIDATPLGRSGRAEEIASAVSFLASPSASYITGTDLLVDGGTIAGIDAIGGPARLGKQ